ncbi:MAG: hypothetical protein HQL61_09915 [Magnetococcales bacterium]|nr:hypothetical protein [Nitrospirota bacterium]
MKKKAVVKDGGNGYVRTSEFNEFKEMFLLMMQKLESMATDITSMKGDITSMKGDITSMKGDITSMKGDIALTRRDIAGLSRSVSYALENEAYRELPRFLKARYGIEVLDSLIRVELKKDSEINILGEGRRHSKPVLIVGEAKLRLQGYYTAGTPNNAQMVEVFEQLERHVEAVRLQCSGVEAGTKEIVRILITHFATADFLTEASKRGVIVIQSYEWQTV